MRVENLEFSLTPHQARHRNKGSARIGCCVSGMCCGEILGTEMQMPDFCGSDESRGKECMQDGLKQRDIMCFVVLTEGVAYISFLIRSFGLNWEGHNIMLASSPLN